MIQVGLQKRNEHDDDLGCREDGDGKREYLPYTHTTQMTNPHICFFKVPHTHSAALQIE